MPRYTEGDTMPDTTYNGWKNYETWAVGMYLDGNYSGPGTYDYVTELVRCNLSFQNFEGDGIERHRIAAHLESFTREEIEGDEPSIASDLLGAALSSVDWLELADAWIENVREQVEA